MSPSADRQSNTGSAIYETTGRKPPMTDELPALEELRKALESDGDLTTKSYDVDELNRLKSMSNRSMSVVAAHEEGIRDDDSEELTTGQLNIADAPAQMKQAFAAPGPDEDDPLDDGPTRARVIEEPPGRRIPMARPLAGMRAPVPRLSPEIMVTPPLGSREEEEEESNDEGPTIKKIGTAASRAERAVLTRGRAEIPAPPPLAAPPPPFAAPPPPEVDEDDPLDDGPTRMRPQEAFPLPAGRIPPPPPAAEPDRASKTAILESLRAELNDDPSRLPLATAPWDEEAPDPLMGATTRLPSVAVTPPVFFSEGSITRSNPGNTTAPFPAAALATMALPTSGAPVIGPWGTPLTPMRGGPMVAPPLGPPPVAPPLGPPPLGPPVPPQPGMSTLTAREMAQLQPAGNRQRLLAALVGVMLGLAVLFVYGAFSEPDPVEPAPASATASVAHPPPPKVSAPPPVTAAPAVNVAEEEARAALTKLRDGISACVQKNQGGLPETTAAVPTSLRMTRPDGYVAKGEDWKGGIWSCSKFKAPGAMHYQLQWQSSKPFLEGAAVAWIDTNGDGTADRAFSFRATMKAKGKVELSDVGPIDPSRKVLSP